MILKADNVQKVTLVELSGTLIKNLRKMPLFGEILDDSRLNLIIDDGRRFLLSTNEKFDLILMDPLRETTSYSNNLYSQQFFQLASRRLNAGGVLMLGTYEQDNSIKRVMWKTILSVFDYVQAHPFFSLASNAPLTKNNEREKSLLASLPQKVHDEILSQKFRAKYTKLYVQDYIREITDRYPVNQDYKPVCEYYIGLKIREKFLPGR